jgi:DNA-binding transcriptional MerR regulator
MRIGELARRTGVDERLLRYYEKQGLLEPDRRPNGYRDYRESDIATVRKIRALLAAGLSTTTIAQVQFCIRNDDEPPTPACDGVIARLVDERTRIDVAITHLQASRAALNKVITAGRHLTRPHNDGETRPPGPLSAQQRRPAAKP